MDEAGTIVALTARLEFAERRITALEAAEAVRKGAQYYAQLRFRILAERFGQALEQTADQFEENKH